MVMVYILAGDSSGDEIDDITLGTGVGMAPLTAATTVMGTGGPRLLPHVSLTNNFPGRLSGEYRS